MLYDALAKKISQNIPKKTGLKSKHISPISLKNNMKKDILNLSESDIQKLILQYLGLKKIFCWRNNTGSGMNTNANGKEYFVRFGVKGAPDILGMLPGGRFLGIEVKRKDGIVSENQKDFLQQINDNGGLGFVARSLEDVMKVIENNGRD